MTIGARPTVAYAEFHATGVIKTIPNLTKQKQTNETKTNKQKKNKNIMDDLSETTYSTNKVPFTIFTNGLWHILYHSGPISFMRMSNDISPSVLKVPKWVVCITNTLEIDKL